MTLSLFDIAGRAMSAQLIRVNATASNLANAQTLSGSAEGAYRARRPLFETAFDEAANATVDARRIVTAGPEPAARHEPGHPLADADGNVWTAGVDETAELIELVEATRQYSNNVEVMNTGKALLLETLRAGS